MTRGVWVIRNGNLIPKHLAPPLHRTFGTAPGIIMDSMGSTMNHADGRRYDSKRAYERAVRAAGCEIIGNETQTPPPKKQMSDPGESLKKAWETLESRTPTPRKKKRKA